MQAQQRCQLLNERSNAPTHKSADIAQLYFKKEEKSERMYKP
jgi:hypothetical protein